MEDRVIQYKVQYSKIPDKIYFCFTSVNSAREAENEILKKIKLENKLNPSDKGVKKLVEITDVYKEKGLYQISTEFVWFGTVGSIIHDFKENDRNKMGIVYKCTKCGLTGVSKKLSNHLIATGMLGKIRYCDKYKG